MAVCPRRDMMEKLVVAKQASDLHSNSLSQRILYQQAYKKQRDAMVSSIEEHFPEEIKYTKPESGVFLWITLPDSISSFDLFNQAIKENVAFVPGSPHPLYRHLSNLKN